MPTTASAQKVKGWRWMILQQDTGYLHSVTGMTVGMDTYLRDGPALQQTAADIFPAPCPHGNGAIPNSRCVCGIYYFNSPAALLSYWAQARQSALFSAETMPQTAVITGVASGPHLPDFLYPDQEGAWRGSHYRITSIAVQSYISERTVGLLADRYRVPVTRGIEAAFPPSLGSVGEECPGGAG